MVDLPTSTTSSSSSSSCQNVQVHSHVSSLEIETPAGFRSPVTPALCKDAEGNPWKKASGDAEEAKGNLSFDLCGIEEGEVAEEEGEGEEKERSTDVPREEKGGEDGDRDGLEALVQFNGRSSCQKESISIGDLAKKARLRVKRVRRSSKPNLLEKRITNSAEVQEIRASEPESRHDLHQKSLSAAKINPSEKHVTVPAQVNEIRISETNGMHIVDQKSQCITKSDSLEEQVAVLAEAKEIRISEPEKKQQLDQISLQSRFSNVSSSLNGIQEPSRKTGEASYLSSIHDQSTSGTQIPLSLKEKILRKSSQSRAKYAEHNVESIKFDELRGSCQETVTKVELSLSNHKNALVSESSRLAELPRDQCISQNTKQENAPCTVNGHMNDNFLTEVNTSNRIENYHSSEDCSENKIKNFEDDQCLPRVYTRREVSVHHRSQESMHGYTAPHHDASTYDMARQCTREYTVMETEFPDEPPGFSLAKAQVRSSDSVPNDTSDMRALENTPVMYDRQVRHSGTGLVNQNADSHLRQGQSFYRFKPRNTFNCVSQTNPGREDYFAHNVPSVLCDKRGKISEQRRENEGEQFAGQYIGPEGRLTENNPSAYGNQCHKPHEYVIGYDNQCSERCEYDMAYDKQGYEAQDYSMGYHIQHNDSQEFPMGYDIQHHNMQEYGMSYHNQHDNQRQDCDALLPNSGYTPFNHSIQLNWRWSSDVGSVVPNNRIKIVKERSIFVGCIPDGIENLDLLLRGLMEQFLERFDFAPIRLGQVQIIKTVKDFAFIELAADKVAQIVLSVNQLDVFEWGVNGYHFNVQGCTATYTSVRPMIEYMPLRPARVIFVGNIPKFRWQKDYLEGYFTKILQGSDGPTDFKHVSSVYLLPESSDAYVEMTCELMADALMFKCTKIPEFLREIGPDVFLCRDMRSVPLMSRHKGTICPQRSLYVEVTPGGVEFKIDSVMKVFGEVLPFIARNSNQRGYLEYVNVQPGKDYAFFQFNTEAFVDAIMDEYIENTQIFVCRDSNVPYTILRPPGYVRPGAMYGSEILNPHPFVPEVADTERSSRGKSVSLDPSTNIGLTLRRFGDEPTKKPDCIISVGASPVPLAMWNELSAGLHSDEPDCMILIDGLPQGYSYRLIHGTLNELFERSLSHTGLLEVQMLVVRYLDYDGNFGVATLPNAEFVCALLSMRNVFVVAGEEIRLLPYDTRRSFHLKGNPVDLSGGHCELSSLSDEDSQGRTVVQNSGEYNPHLTVQSEQGYSEIDRSYPPGYDTVDRQFNLEDATDDWCQSETWSAPSHDGFRNRESSQWDDAKSQSRRWNPHVTSVRPFRKTSEEQYCEGNNPRVRVPHIQKYGSGPYNNAIRGQESESRLRKKCPDEGFRIINREGNTRMFQQVRSPSISEKDGLVELGRKRKPSDIVQGIPVNMNGLNQRKIRYHSHFP